MIVLGEYCRSTRMRVSECTGLKLEDIDFELKTMLLHGKGRKDRYVPFGSYCYTSLKRYLAKSRKPLMAKYIDPPNFTGRTLHDDFFAHGNLTIPGHRSMPIVAYSADRRSSFAKT